MGWWSTGILGGDTPYDFKDEFYGICEVEEYGENSRNLISKETFSIKLPEILEYIEASECDKEIGYKDIVQWKDESYQKILDIFQQKLQETEVEPKPKWIKEQFLNTVHYWEHDVLWVDGYGYIMASNKTLYIYKTYEDLHK